MSDCVAIFINIGHWIEKKDYIVCNSGYIHYNFNPTKCFIDTNQCTKYWKLDEDYNVECIDICPYTHYIIHREINKNQLAEN